MKALRRRQRQVITIVGKTSDFHVTEVLRVTLEENLAMIADSVALPARSGPRGDLRRRAFLRRLEGEPRVRLRRRSAPPPRPAPRLVVLCDTNGGSMPEEIADLTRAAIAGLDVPVGIHCHNDCELAVANSLAAVDAGAVQVQGTINGLGERCGNVDLISVIANLALKKPGYEVLAARQRRALDRAVAVRLRDWPTCNCPPNQPFVGTSAFAHKGGMHVHAVARATASYEHIAPERVGNERRILVSELSGRSNIMALTAESQPAARSRS